MFYHRAIELLARWPTHTQHCQHTHKHTHTHTHTHARAHIINGKVIRLISFKLSVIKVPKSSGYLPERVALFEIKVGMRGFAGPSESKWRSLSKRSNGIN